MTISGGSPASSSPLLFDREPLEPATGVRNAWNAVTTRDSSSSYRHLDEHTLE